MRTIAFAVTFVASLCLATGLQARRIASPAPIDPLNVTEMTTDYTLTLNDQNGLVFQRTPNAATLTVPTNASVALAIGSRVWVMNWADPNLCNGTSFAAEAGVTLINVDYPPGYQGRPNGYPLGNICDGTAVMIKVDTDTWAVTVFPHY